MCTLLDEIKKEKIKTRVVLPSFSFLLYNRRGNKSKKEKGHNKMIQQKGRINAIDISQILGKVTIKSHENEDVFIETTEEEKVAITIQGKTLYIQTKLSEKEKEDQEKSGIFGTLFGGVHITNTRGNTVVINNGNVIVNGATSTEMATVDMTIFVPSDCIEEIDVSGAIELHIASISKKLSLDCSVQINSTIQGVERVALDLSGQSHLHIADAQEVIGDVSGQSHIQIESETMKKIIFDASGMSKIQVNSSAVDEVELDISGMTDVTIRGQVKTKTIDKSGLAKVNFLR